MAQTCCGQPAYNSGDRADARAIAESAIAAFEDYDYVVAPSGSCAGMLKKHYPGLFSGDPALGSARRRLLGEGARAGQLPGRRARRARRRGAARGTVTYHNSCSGLRELGIRQQPRRCSPRSTG